MTAPSDLLGPPTVTVNGLRKRFGSTLALDGVAAAFGPGVNGLLGPNGAGKTTLLRILATVLPADEGRAEVMGADPTSADGVPPVPAGEQALGFDANRRELHASRLRVALQAIGLPAEAGPDKRPLVLAGQARGVVTLWAATRGLEVGTLRQLTSGRTSRNGDNSGPADAFDRGYVWPAECGTSPVVWSAQDLRAARALAALPGGTVQAAVDQSWARWRDPATGTDELLAALGLPSVGPFDAVQTRIDDPC